MTIVQNSLKDAYSMRKRGSSYFLRCFFDLDLLSFCAGKKLAQGCDFTSIDII